jgi:hypothetical protein
VRFQTSKIFSVEDPEIVLRALESCLRDAPINVVRFGPRITLQGLGPSPRSINHHDTTILHVELDEDQIVINADVSFQASCFMTDAQQNEVVSSKLDQIFDQVKFEIASEQERNWLPSQSPHIASSSVAPAENNRFSHLLAEQEEPEFTSPADTPAPLDASVLPSQVSTLTAFLERHRELEPVESASSIDVLDVVETMQPEQNPETQSDWVQSLKAGSVHSLASIRIEPSVPKSIEPLAEKSHHWPILTIIFCILLLTSGLYLAHLNKKVSTERAISISTPSAHSTTSLPVRQTPPQPTIATPSNPALSVADPHQWLQNWVAAMRTRDPAAQVSFYADPVGNYLGKKDVSHVELFADKKAAIQNRAALWTVKLGKISVVRQSATNVVVHLIKHSMAQSAPGQMSEQFTPTRLQLQKINGQWKIVSEQERSKSFVIH